MAYDEKTAERIRNILADRHDVSERKMFGGLCFMVGGQMVCGLTHQLMVRVGKENYEAALASPHTAVMAFTGRPLAGYIYVLPPGYKTAASLTKWVMKGVACVLSLPPAKKRKKKPRPIVAKARKK